MTLIGGGAGMLSELLPEGRTAVDVDVMEVTPPEVFDLCCYDAPAIAEECGLNPTWFDPAPFNLRHMMLAGWRDRTVPIGEFGPLGVRAIARIDLISLKFSAGRERDLNDLETLQITAAESRLVIEQLPTVLEHGADPDVVERAIVLAKAWRCSGG